MRQWRRDNRGHIRDYLRTWRANNPELAKQQNDRNKEYKRKYTQENKEHIRLYNIAYRRKYPDRIALWKLTRRIKLKGFEADLTEEQWCIIKNVFRQKCVYCGKRTRRLEKDHVVPLSKGGALTLSNIVPACHSCNSKKGATLPQSPLQTLFL